MDKYDRKFTVAITLIAFTLIAGTSFYHLAEGWDLVDSFYFTGATLTTVGYGDLYPSHDFSKIVTVFFMFAGIGIVFYSISIIGQKYFEREEERLQKVWEATRERGEELRDAIPAKELRKVATRITRFNKAKMLSGIARAKNARKAVGGTATQPPADAAKQTESAADAHQRS